jgi:hypothetical protein
MNQVEYRYDEAVMLAGIASFRREREQQPVLPTRRELAVACDVIRAAGVSRATRLKIAWKEDREAAYRRHTAAMMQIAAVVCGGTGCTLQQLLMPSNAQQAVWRRAMAITLMRRHSEASYTVIAQLFNKHHTTMIHGVNLVHAALRNDHARRRQFEGLEAVLLSRLGRGDARVEHVETAPAVVQPAISPTKLVPLVNQVAKLYYYRNGLQFLRRSANAADVYLRGVMAILLRKYAEMSYPALGAIFGVHHTTVMQTSKRVQAMCETIPAAKTALLTMERDLLQRMNAGMDGNVPRETPRGTGTEVGDGR